MLVLSLSTSLAVMIVTRRNKGPVWAMALMWAICIAPVTVGMIGYRFVDDSRWLLDLVVTGSILVFAAGALMQHVYRGSYRAQPIDPALAADDFLRMRSVCRALWLLGMVGGTFIVLDFVSSGGGSLVNLSELRDSFVSRDSATIFGRVGSLLTWACPFCYLFALIFRDRMRPLEVAFFILPIGAFMLGAILSAGRQAAFQILLFTIVGQVLYRLRGGEEAKRKGRVFLYVMGTAMVGYMGFVAVARNDNRISDIKAEVLARLFDYQTAPWFDSILDVFGSGIRNTIVEAVVYFTSSVALFDRFLDTRLEGISYGAMNLPFLYRQLSFLTGIDVAAMYDLKVATLNAQSVIGVGWTTSVSHLIMDFGFTGSAVLLFVQGFVGTWAWRRAVSGGDFIDCMLAALMVIAAVYLPLLPAFSDTNLFFMLVFCFVWRWFGPRPVASDERHTLEATAP